MKIIFPKLKKNYRKESFKISPHTYWGIVVILFFVSILVSFIFADNLFRETSKESKVLQGSNRGKLEKQKKDEINKMLQYFSEREQKTIDIQNSPASIIDPSL